MERDFETLSQLVVEKVKSRAKDLKDQENFKIPSISRLGKHWKDYKSMSKDSLILNEEKPKSMSEHQRQKSRRNNSDNVVLEPLPQNCLDLPPIETETAETSLDPIFQPIDDSVNRSILGVFNRVGREQSRESKKLNKTVICPALDISIEGISSHPHFRAQKKPSLRPQITELPKLDLAKKTHKTPKKVQKIEKLKICPREIVWNKWLKLIQSSNAVDVQNKTTTFKYYIGKGNNSPLVNHIMKSRWWWTRIENSSQANLIWTQLKHRSTIESLPDFSGVIEEQILQETPSKFAQSEVEGTLLIKNSPSYARLKTIQNISEIIRIHNRLPNNSSLCSKKKLFINLKAYYDSLNEDIFQVVPTTFHIDSLNCQSWNDFNTTYTPNSTWIIKPGENTNRGNGIRVSNSLQEINEIVSLAGSKERTFIIQKYLDKPLLINKRKFDIRCYALVTSINGYLQAYFYEEGYLRTASKEFSLKSNDKFIHLTNDAVQNKCEEYGKFESGNKLSYSDFQKYLTANYPEMNFYDSILPQIKKFVFDSVKAVKGILNDQKKMHAFEVFGYDFMIDRDFKVWLIEVNTNPCLELGCSYLAKLIPAMLENAFRIAIDPLFPPPVENKKYKQWVEGINFKNEYSLGFSMLRDNGLIA